MEQSSISKLEIQHIYNKLDEIHKELKEMNGNVERNTNFRIGYEALKLPEHFENLQKQFSAHYTEMSKIKPRIYLIAGCGGIIGGFLIELFKEFIFKKL